MPVFSTLRLMTLPLDLHLEIGDRLDMLSLLCLGGTCLYFRHFVMVTLKRERKSIIEKYWVQAITLLPILTRYRAVITGEAALAFLMRDQALLGPELEICVSNIFGDDLLQEIETFPFLHHAWNDDIWPALDNRRPTAFLYRTDSGHLIRIIWSHTDSPFTCMSGNPTTALFNYMDEFSFGCAYPNLTLNGRAVAPNFDFLPHDEAERVIGITNRGHFHQSPWSASVSMPPVPFALYNQLAVWNDPTAEDLTNTVCLRHMYQCTGQSRFFGDPGSLIDYFEPDMVDHAVMAHLIYPPYGATAIWRMEGPPCDYYCVEGDYLLHDCMSAVSMTANPVSYGPFTTALVGCPKVGESQHRRVWNASIEDITLVERNVLFNI